jgi:hypothetical protein
MENKNRFRNLVCKDGGMMEKQKMIMVYACLDTDLIGGYPPTTYNGETIRNDAICEVMNTATREIYKMYKMYNAHWYEYIVGETAYPTTVYQEWFGYPDTPADVPTAEYPHQIIVVKDGLTRLYASKQQIVYNWGTPGWLDTYPATTEEVRGFVLNEGEWISGFDVNLYVAYPDNPVLKTNRDIININSGAVVIERNV